MKKVLWITLLCLPVAACDTVSDAWDWMWEPEVVASNERFITIYDPVGLEGHSLALANKYCQRYDLHAQYHSLGGDDRRCRDLVNHDCITYHCVP